MRLISKSKAIGLQEHDGLILTRHRFNTTHETAFFLRIQRGGALISFQDIEADAIVEGELEVNGIGR